MPPAGQVGQQPDHLAATGLVLDHAQDDMPRCRPLLPGQVHPGQVGPVRQVLDRPGRHAGPRPDQQMGPGPGICAPSSKAPPATRWPPGSWHCGTSDSPAAGHDGSRLLIHWACAWRCPSFPIVSSDPYADLADSISRFASPFREVLKGNQWPAPGSPAAAEAEGEPFAGEWSAFPSRDVLASTLLAAAAAADHLAAAGSVLRGRNAVFAPYTVMRTAAEAAAMAVYLTDSRALRQ